MCGKAAVSHLSWADVYAYTSSLTPPSVLPTNPESRINISPSRLRRKSEPESMVWETLPVIHCDESGDTPAEAIWPFIPVYSEGRLPMNKQGRLISTANARLRLEGAVDPHRRRGEHPEYLGGCAGPQPPGPHPGSFHSRAPPRRAAGRSSPVDRADVGGGRR